MLVLLIQNSHWYSHKLLLSVYHRFPKRKTVCEISCVFCRISPPSHFLQSWKVIRHRIWQKNKHIYFFLSIWYTRTSIAQTNLTRKNIALLRSLFVYIWDFETHAILTWVYLSQVVVSVGWGHGACIVSCGETGNACNAGDVWYGPIGSRGHSPFRYGVVIVSKEFVRLIGTGLFLGFPFSENHNNCIFRFVIILLFDKVMVNDTEWLRLGINIENITKDTW